MSKLSTFIDSAHCNSSATPPGHAASAASPLSAPWPPQLPFPPRRGAKETTMGWAPPHGATCRGVKEGEGALRLVGRQSWCRGGEEAGRGQM